jgi:hypothetical protein
MQRTMMTKVNNKLSLFSTVLGIVAFFLGIFSSSTSDPDLWGYLAFGRLFWETGFFPYQDVFSYTSTKAVWIYHEWLTGVIFFPIHKFFGAGGLQLLKYLLGMMTVALVYVTAIRQKAKPFFVFLALMLAGNVIRFGYSPVRAQVFTFCFFILSLYLLDRAKTEKHWKYLWWLVPMELVWCNLHGGFVVGLGMIGLYAIGEAFSGRKYRPYAAILLVATLVTLINPYGYEYWQYVFEAILMPRPEIGEWQNVFSAILSGEYRGYGALFIVVFLISVPLMLWYPRRDLTTCIILSMTAMMGFLHIRHIVFFALAFGVFMPPVLTEFWEHLRNNPNIVKRYSRFRIIGLTLILLIVSYTIGSSFLRFVSGTPFELRTPSAYYPVGAAEMIKKNNLKGNILPYFEWGEYLLWTLYPDCKVGMDGRYETVYRDEVCKEYFDFLFARDNWRDFLKKYPHHMVLVKSESKIRFLLEDDPNWRLAYDGEDSTLFLRR